MKHPTTSFVNIIERLTNLHPKSPFLSKSSHLFPCTGKTHYLAIFGEVVCSVGFIAGLFYRLALIPMIFTMCVAFFAVHGGDPFAARELALAYLSVYVLMYAAGPGLYAADTLIARRLPKPRR